jgi:hypothetical protein
MQVPLCNKAPRLATKHFLRGLRLPQWPPACLYKRLESPSRLGCTDLFGFPMQPVVWNRGDCRCKLVTMALTKTIQQATLDVTGSFTRSVEGSR